MSVVKFSTQALADHLPARIDVFICCASFESRCLTVARALDPTKVGQGIVVQNLTLTEFIQPNAEQLVHHFDAYTSVATAELNVNDPVNSEDNIHEVLTETCSGRSELKPRTYL